MATADSVKANLQSIITKANNKTGRSDSNVNSAVDALISGFGAGGITPSGTKTITANGTHDVTQYASAQVNVPIPAQNCVVEAITISSALGAGTNTNAVILSDHAFVKAHYADDGFSALLIPLNGASAAASGIAGPIWCGNRAIFTTKSTYYGIGLRSAGESSGPVVVLCTSKINGSGYNISLRADSSGNIRLYVASSFTVPAGNYLLVLLTTD